MTPTPLSAQARIEARAMNTSKPTRSLGASQANAGPDSVLLGGRGASTRQLRGAFQRGGKIPWIEDVDCPIIGQRYSVPVVRVKKGVYGRSGNNCGMFRSRELVPVIGPEHEDAEHIKFPERHWHVDWRFVTDRAFTNAMRTPFFKSEDTDQEWRVLSRVIRASTVYYDSRSVRIMRRAMPAHEGHVWWQEELEKAFTGSRLTKCGKCPHRGLPLANLPARPDGTIICPGHALRFDKATGAMVPRPNDGPLTFGRP